MAITRKRKEELVAQYVDMLGKSDAVFVAEYTGMSVKTMETLRKEARKANGAVFVAKNTLLRIALEQAGRPVPTNLLNQQVMATFSLGEAPALAKTLTEFAKKEEKLQVKGGVFGYDLLTADQVKALADMPSLDQLRGQLLGILSAPARNIASVVAGGIRQVVNVIDAYAKKDEASAAA
ncbi:MAG: 50S ribosomal protein L10 [Chloroflexi bacterium]|nr:50S ribosomal protein L10 [Chloroflexota bacterium]